MIKQCPNCGEKFTPNVNQRKYCTRCSELTKRGRQQLRKDIWFKREWQSWKRDFALGGTISNVY